MIGQWEDEYGTWTKQEDGALIHNPSQKWYDENPPQEPEPQPPTPEEEIEALKAENAMLQSSVMELTMYAAGQEDTLIMQDKRITTQESAVMELSMLVAGGMTDV